MIMYVTRGNHISAAEVLRETEKMVVLASRVRNVREAKRSEYQNWFHSFVEAKEFLVDQAKRKVAKARAALEREKCGLEQILGMQEEC